MAEETTPAPPETEEARKKRERQAELFTGPSNVPIAPGIMPVDWPPPGARIGVGGSAPMAGSNPGVASSGAVADAAPGSGTPPSYNTLQAYNQATYGNPAGIPQTGGVGGPSGYLTSPDARQFMQQRDARQAAITDPGRSALLDAFNQSRDYANLPGLNEPGQWEANQNQTVAAAQALQGYDAARQQMNMQALLGPAQLAKTNAETKYQLAQANQKQYAEEMTRNPTMAYFSVLNKTGDVNTAEAARQEALKNVQMMKLQSGSPQGGPIGSAGSLPQGPIGTQGPPIDPSQLGQGTSFDLLQSEFPALAPLFDPKKPHTLDEITHGLALSGVKGYNDPKSRLGSLVRSHIMSRGGLQNELDPVIGASHTVPFGRIFPENPNRAPNPIVDTTRWLFNRGIVNPLTGGKFGASDEAEAQRTAARGLVRALSPDYMLPSDDRITQGNY